MRRSFMSILKVTKKMKYVEERVGPESERLSGKARDYTKPGTSLGYGAWGTSHRFRGLVG